MNNKKEILATHLEGLRSTLQSAAFMIQAYNYDLCVHAQTIEEITQKMHELNDDLDLALERSRTVLNMQIEYKPTLDE